MKINKITGCAILLAIVIVLQLIANQITIGGVSITLALVPVVLGAVLFGPLAGAFLGFGMGIITLISPTTISVFFAESPIGTIITCLVKSTLAGFLSGVIYKAFSHLKKKRLGIIISSMAAPIINTGLFAIFALIFFRNIVEEASSTVNGNFLAGLFLIMIGFNFIIEFILSSALSSGIVTIVDYYDSRNRR